SGLDITAKDFRTWAGTLHAALALTEIGASETITAAKRNLKLAVEQVAALLGNTVTICRKCYIHPQVVDCYLEGRLHLSLADEASGGYALNASEAALLSFLTAVPASSPA